MNKPSIRIAFTAQFRREAKRLRKKYRHIDRDVATLVTQLRDGELIGDQVQGTGHTVYKVRLKSSDLARGKRGGYRVIYYLKTTSFIVLLMIYTKSERADLSQEQIRRIIEEYEPPES